MGGQKKYPRYQGKCTCCSFCNAPLEHGSRILQMHFPKGFVSCEKNNGGVQYWCYRDYARKKYHDNARPIGRNACIFFTKTASRKNSITPRKEKGGQCHHCGYCFVSGDFVIGIQHEGTEKLFCSGIGDETIAPLRFCFLISPEAQQKGLKKIRYRIS